ncbi:MAG: dockerin type I repeat-containing protein [Candidatus Pacebacteria bacterium]|nr:dockerin type I repeat-containing protein [Candidatus Paceibacterota bacterium]
MNKKKINSNKNLFFLGFIFFLIFAVSSAEKTYSNSVDVTATVSSTTTPPVLYCGDNSCNNNETCSSCPRDCGACPTGGSGGSNSDNSPSVSTPPPVIITQATFKGRAYPSSDVKLVKDGVAVASTKSGPDANFEISVSGLSSGSYMFGLWAEDQKGNRSLTNTFNVSVTAGISTTVSGIFLPPTINLDKSEVKRGDILNIFGQTVPEAEVALFINSNEELVKRTTADDSGSWLYKFDTSEIEQGSHTTKARSAKNGNFSMNSQTISFKVGSKSVLEEVAKKPGTEKIDLNGDQRVNIVEFSIAAYWYKRTSPPASVDLNNDGKVNLVDFSIMAYYWTG